MVYPEVLFPPNFIIKVTHLDSLVIVQPLRKSVIEHWEAVVCCCHRLSHCS